MDNQTQVQNSSVRLQALIHKAQNANWSIDRDCIIFSNGMVSDCLNPSIPFILRHKDSGAKFMNVSQVFVTYPEALCAVRLLNHIR